MSEARRGRSSLAAPSWQWLLLTPHPRGRNRAQAEVRGPCPFKTTMRESGRTSSTALSLAVISAGLSSPLRAHFKTAA